MSARPIPSSPSPFVPQHQALPSVASPHAARVPVSMVRNRWPPATGTGTLLPASAPLPNSPFGPNGSPAIGTSPQQYAIASIVTPQVKVLPALTLAHFRPPATISGT